MRREFKAIQISTPKYEEDIFRTIQVNECARIFKFLISGNSTQIGLKRRMNGTPSFSTEEVQVYDRQLRLWGVKSQLRLRQSKIVLLGFNNLQAEICKNIVLAGLSHLIIIDWTIVTEDNAVPHMFLDASKSIGCNRIETAQKRVRELNPHAEITAVAVECERAGVDKALETIAANECDLLVVSGVRSQAALMELSGACHRCHPPESHQICAIQEREPSLPILLCQSSGFVGHFFLDLGDHAYMKANSCLVSRYADYKSFLNSKMVCQTTPQHSILKVISEFERRYNSFPTRDDPRLMEEKKKVLHSFDDPRAMLSDESLMNYVENFETEVCPVTAVVGGLVAQEIIKILTASDPPPFDNFFFFDGITGSNYVNKYM